MIILCRKREEMSQFGTGNHITLSTSNGETVGARRRKFIGFNGPIMVEGVKVGASGGLPAKRLASSATHDIESMRHLIDV